MKHTPLVLLLLSALAASAEAQSPKLGSTANHAEAVSKPECAKDTGLVVLCSYIRNHSEAKIPLRNHRYEYFSVIAGEACVLEDDPEELVKEKIRKVWGKIMEKECNDAAFEVPRGNIVKYAVHYNLDRFIRDVSRWGVDVNKVDEYDDGTVLDYIQTLMERYKGIPHELKLQMYYNQLRKAGARHKTEL